MGKPRFRHPGAKTVALGMLAEALYVAVLAVMGLIVSFLVVRW